MNTYKVLRKTSHIVLALLLLVSTTGMTVSLHYCNHSLYDIGIFTRAESCCMTQENMTETNVHDHCAADLQQKGHCEDETIALDHVDDFLATAFQADLTTQITTTLSNILASAETILFQPFSSKSAEIPPRDNAPPGVMSEPSFLQSFLI